MTILVVTETAGTVVEIEKHTTEIEIAPFDTGVGAVLKSTIEGKGEIFVGTEAGVVDNLPVGPNESVLTADSTQPKGVKWATPTSGVGYSEMTNKSGGTTNAGDVVVFETVYDRSFTTTTTAGSLRVCGVVVQTIANNASGLVATLGGQIVSVNCDTAAVARGQWLMSSSTEKKATPAGYFMTNGCFALALTSKDSGSSGSVYAMLVLGFLQGIKGTAGWSLGGCNSAVSGNGQKFTFENGAWETIVAAALPSGAVRTGNCGIGNTTVAMYSIGGSTTNGAAGGTVTAYKMPFSNNQTATQSSADVASARWALRSGFNGPDRGYVVGGQNTSTSVQTAVYKLTFSNDTMSSALGTTLSVARSWVAGMSNGTYCYAVAGSGAGNCDKITISSDTVADHNDGDVTNGDATLGYNGGVSFQGAVGAGHVSFKNGATAYSKKITFSSGVASNVTSTVPADQTGAGAVGNGASLGWFFGDDASPYSVTHKLSGGTDTYAADTGAVMNVGKFNQAYANHGAY